MGPMSARAAQIARNINRYEREWASARPGEHPGPALQRAWDAQAWAKGRPDKVTPQPGVQLEERWRTELAALGYRDASGPVALTPTPVGALDRDAAADRVLSRLAAGRSAWNPGDIRRAVERLIAAENIVTDAAVRLELGEDLTARALRRCPAAGPGGGAGAHPVLDLAAGARRGGRPWSPGSPPAPASRPRTDGGRSCCPSPCGAWIAARPR
jgi:exodeoxyribonuclease V alpha subunit